jgi:hypothetical protein
LLESKGARKVRPFNLPEVEIRGYYLKSRDMFLSLPMLLELEAPIKSCGNLFVDHYGTSMVNLLIY